MISNLLDDLVNEILTRVPMTSMRAVQLTCKKWNDLSKCQSFRKMHIGKALAAAKKGESPMIMKMGSTLYLMRIIVINGDPSIEHKGKLTCLDKQVKISQFFHCEGLLLCILKGGSKFVVWNPFLGQSRLVELRFSHPPNAIDRFSYALGYDDKKSQSCRSHKFLRFIDDPEKLFFWYEIYDFDSGLWTTLDVTPYWRIELCHRGVSLKGNTYWCAGKRNQNLFVDCIICFDFTSERFGPLLPLPLIGWLYDDATLSCVGEEKLALSMGTNRYELVLWITTKIETEEVLWSQFFRVETAGFDRCAPFIISNGRFYIDDEKNLAIGDNEDDHRRRSVIVIEEAEYVKALDLELQSGLRRYRPELWLCSYVPSLVQIKQPAGGEGKIQSDLEKRRFDENMSRISSLGTNVL